MNRTGVIRTFKLTIAYDGTRYAGWQAQRYSSQQSAASNKPERKPTIQGTLEQTLKRILQESVKVIGSGRTDAGVHAIAQVAHVRTRSRLSCNRLLRSVNQLLPSDIALTQIEQAHSAFHARFHATRKRYRYCIFTGSVVPPFIRPYVLHFPDRLNAALMRREAAYLKNRHDFRAFAQAKSVRQRSTIRTITDVQFKRQGPQLQIEVEGNGFLHTMVRSIVGTLMDVGRGHLPPGTIRRMVQSKNRDMAGSTAPARGLTLLRVHY